MKWTNRTMGLACILGCVMTVPTALAAVGLMGLAMWKTRQRVQD